MQEILVSLVRLSYCRAFVGKTTDNASANVPNLGDTCAMADCKSLTKFCARNTGITGKIMPADFFVGQSADNASADAS